MWRVDRRITGVMAGRRSLAERESVASASAPDTIGGILTGMGLNFPDWATGCVTAQGCLDRAARWMSARPIRLAPGTGGVLRRPRDRDVQLGRRRGPG